MPTISPREFEKYKRFERALETIRDNTSDMWACDFAGEIIKGKTIEGAEKHAFKYAEDEDRMIRRTDNNEMVGE